MAESVTTNIVCFKCHQTLGRGERFFEVEAGKNLCASCMDDSFSKECFHCHKDIQQYNIGHKQISSKDGTKHWHDFCFICTACNKSLVGCAYYPGKTSEDERYCDECFDKMTGSVCDKCQQLIMRYTKGEKEILSQDGSKHWHSGCFMCYKCGEPLVGKGYYPKDGSLFCENCVKSSRRQK